MNNNLTLFNQLYTDDGAIEIFATENGIRLIHDGHQFTSYAQLPTSPRRFIDKYMMEFPHAFAIVHKSGLRGADVTDSILRCLFGGCDTGVDFDMNSGKVTPEYPAHCASCQWEKPFCTRAITPLTEAETNVAIAIAKGQTDKEIAYHTGRSVKTIRNHRTNLEQKLKASTGQVQNSATITGFIIQSGV